MILSRGIEGIAGKLPSLYHGDGRRCASSEPRDRTIVDVSVLGVALRCLWPGWQNSLIIVKPKTVIGWHRKRFKLDWTRKSRRRGGRPPIDAEIRTHIRRIDSENPTWGAPRVHGELLTLGSEVGETTVLRSMPLRRKPPSQTRHAFLRNHTQDLVSIDYFVVPTAAFRVLCMFLVLEHERRRIVHFNVTEDPSAQWTGQQLVNAFPDDSAPQSPWQNPYCERTTF